MSARTADRIRAIAESMAPQQVTIGAVIDRFGAAGTGLCLLVLGLTALVPGIAPVFGVALCTLSFGMMLGRQTAYVPGPLRRRTLNAGRLQRGLRRLAPVVAWLERWLHPRAAAWLGGWGTRAAGAASLLCGILIVLPIPFGNTAPAVAVLVLALGLVMQDGVAVAAGLGLTALATLIDAALVMMGYTAFVALFNRLV